MGGHKTLHPLSHALFLLRAEQVTIGHLHARGIEAVRFGQPGDHRLAPLQLALCINGKGSIS